MNARLHHCFSLADFLAWENVQPERHEFHRGEVFAMTGPRRVHGVVVGNLHAALHRELSGAPCRAFAESMKVQIGDDTILYPDVFVTCSKADLRTDMIFREPLVVVEVLSPSSERYDRGAKFALYRRLASLREFVLIDPDSRAVEAFRRSDAGDWTLRDLSGTGTLAMPAIGFEMPLAKLFDGVESPPEAEVGVEPPPEAEAGVDGADGAATAGG
jgi:Uma2 family endonuclease